MTKKTSLYIIALLFLTIVSCSKDDNDDVIDLPTVDDITEVVIAPTEVKFTEIGQTQEFSAKAYNKDGLEIGAKYSWTSSNSEVVAIRPNGIAEAISPGSAMIYVTVNDVTDSADVTVDLDVDPSIWWVSAESGNWSEASNWSTGIVPSATDTVAIILEGDYTVTLSEEITVAHLRLGAPDGTQRLATGTNQLTIESGTFSGGAEIQVDGTTTINGEVEWRSGDITGEGTLAISSQANVVAGIDSQTDIRIKVPFTNSGIFAIVPGANIFLDGVALENTTSGIIDLLGDNASLWPINSGSVLNSGNLVKSAGNGTAWIQSSELNHFVNEGFLHIESGSLTFRDGQLNGVVEIAENADLSQRGYTLFHGGLIQRGLGVLEITGRITLGQEQGEQIKLENILLNSFFSTSSIEGPGDLSVNGSFVWDRGAISGDGTIITYGETLFEGTGIKQISERKFIVVGTLETETLLNLTLANGAQLELNTPNSHWTHNGSGSIKQLGEQSKIIVYTTFVKKGSGFLNIKPDFSCAGTMHLTEGVVEVEGAFNLQETGTIIGGSTDISSEVYVRRLQFKDSNPAVLAGTIDIDADGEQAYMGIRGAVTLAPTFKVLVDIKQDEVIPADRLVFQPAATNSPSIDFNGTVDVSIHGIPPENVEYRVVSAFNATGEFVVNGADWFYDIQQDADGVLLIRN